MQLQNLEFVLVTSAYYISNPFLEIHKVTLLDSILNFLVG